jgi:hypothetical protein
MLQTLHELSSQGSLFFQHPFFKLKAVMQIESDQKISAIQAQRGFQLFDHLVGWRGAPLKCRSNGGANYSCTITLAGWTGATWSGNMTVNTGGYVCHNGATGPAVAPASNLASSGVFTFTNQSVNVSPVTQNFSLGKVSTDCP